MIQSHSIQMNQNSNPKRTKSWTGFESRESRWLILNLSFNSLKAIRKKICVKVQQYLCSKARDSMDLDALPTASCSCVDSTVSINTKINNDNTIYLIIPYSHYLIFLFFNDTLHSSLLPTSNKTANSIIKTHKPPILLLSHFLSLIHYESNMGSFFNSRGFYISSKID